MLTKYTISKYPHSISDLAFPITLQKKTYVQVPNSVRSSSDSDERILKNIAEWRSGSVLGP